jgi:hypothetical protein
MNIWDSFNINDGEYGYFQLRKLHLWIKKNYQEWIVGWKQKPEYQDGISMQILDACPEESIEWHRKVVKNTDSLIHLSPLMPEKAVVVKPESALQITAGAEALFYVSIPVWIGVFTGKPQSALFEIPTVSLSNTWFGEPHNGSLCYSLKTSIYSILSNFNLNSNEAVCPVQIKNTTSVDLDFTRLCIQTDYLNIYKIDKEMWTNRLHVHFRGFDKESNIIYENSCPEKNREFTLVCKSRKKYSKSFAIKSFDTFKFFT